MTERSPVLEAHKLTKSYRAGLETIPVLSGISLSLGKGESLSIRGESGSGKTTLLNILAGLDDPDSGFVEWNGRRISSNGKKATGERTSSAMGFVFQAIHLLPELTAEENVLMAARVARLPLQSYRVRASLLLERVGLSARKKHLPSRLSGGERQRVAVARALLCKPHFILADEPTGNLDEQTAEVTIDLLLGLCSEEGSSLVLVTHHPSHAAKTMRQAILTKHALHEITGAAERNKHVI